MCIICQTKLHTIESVALRAAPLKGLRVAVYPCFAKGKSFYHLCNPASLKKEKNIHNKTRNLRLFYPICMSLHWHGAKVYTLFKKS